MYVHCCWLYHRLTRAHRHAVFIDYNNLLEIRHWCAFWLLSLMVSVAFFWAVLHTHCSHQALWQSCIISFSENPILLSWGCLQWSAAVVASSKYMCIRLPQYLETLEVVSHQSTSGSCWSWNVTLKLCLRLKRLLWALPFMQKCVFLSVSLCHQEWWVFRCAPKSAATVPTHKHSGLVCLFMTALSAVCLILSSPTLCLASVMLSPAYTQVCMPKIVFTTKN